MAALRIDVGLSSLIAALLPAQPGEHEQDVAGRHERALQEARDVLNSYPDLPTPPDIGQTADEIKQKFWRDDNAPEKAVQFGNLYSRLLTLPILTQKQSILHLLHQLADGGHVQLPQKRSDSRSAMPPPSVNGARSRPAARQNSNPPGGLQDAKPSHLNRQPDHDAIDAKFKAVSIHDESSEGHIERKRPTRREPGPTPRPSRTPAEKTALEASLLRDLPFIFQALGSDNFSFESSSILSLPSNIPLPLISLLNRLAEPALLYRGLTAFVQNKSVGLISQSLRAAIDIELRSYLGLIATLENEIRSTLVSLQEASPATQRRAGVTLKRCLIWMREASMGLRLMSLVAQESKAKIGGQLITLLHSFMTDHGDPFVNRFAERMLVHMTSPFYHMLQQWIYDGELHDPYSEFFVAEQAPGDEVKALEPRRAPATSIWETKYRLNQELVPSIVTEELARKIFLIGKSLNFIRYNCGDSGWVDNYSKESSQELHYGDTANLEASIDRAYTTTMARLIHLMDKKFKIFEHLNALKRYLLLGQGDFIALLMESLASNLDRPAGSQYRHTLTAQLDHAIRGSNAQYDSLDVLKRLDARLLELNHGDIGWDVFTLEYKVDAPADVVFTSWANKQYLAVFNFLWRLKRVEFALGTAWRRLMTGARGVLASATNSVGQTWKRVRCCLAEMVHFLDQLQYYILFEVIEASWDELQTTIHRPECTLDDLIAAHTQYLNSITHKGLLGAARTTLTDRREDSFMSQLHYLLKVMLAYKDAVDGLFSYSVAEFTRRQAQAAQLETRSGSQRLGNAELEPDELVSPAPGDRVHARRAAAAERERNTDSPSLGLAAGDVPDDQVLAALQTRLKDLAAEFRTRLATLLGDLLLQPDPDLKFLAVVMNFNDFYRPTRRKRREAREPETGKATNKAQANDVVTGVQVAKQAESDQLGQEPEKRKVAS